MQKKPKLPKRKITVVTGTRAEYGILKPLLLELKKNPKFELHLIVAGMHLSKKFGLSIKEITNDGFKISGKIEMLPKGDLGYDMSIALSKGITQFSNIYKKINPDYNIILGDRDEAFAGAIAAMHMNIVNVHLHGGEISKGGIDEYMRHAITKISNIHFAATTKSAQRIKKMGENSKYIFVTGSPAIDGINQKYPPKNLILKKYGLDKNYAILIQHSITTQIKESKNQIKITLDALVKLQKNTIIIGPNSDAGNKDIFNTITKYVKTHSLFHFYNNLPRNEFLSILKYSDFIIGNSSSGIIDAPSFKIPAINIGIRQEGRESSTNIIPAKHSIDSIIKAVKTIDSTKFQSKLKKCKNPYGDGHSSSKIMKILNTIKISDDLIQKKLQIN